MANDWYCLVNDNVLGPLSDDEVLAMAVAGNLAPTDMVRKQVDGRWVEARRLKGITFPDKSALAEKEPENTDSDGVVNCPHCGETITSRGAQAGTTMNCHSCRGTFVVPNATVETVPTVWFLKAGICESGPLSLDQISTMAAEGHIQAEDLIKLGRHGTWQAAATVSGISFPGASTPAPTELPYTRNEPVLVDSRNPPPSRNEPSRSGNASQPSSEVAVPTVASSTGTPASMASAGAATPPAGSSTTGTEAEQSENNLGGSLVLGGIAATLVTPRVLHWLEWLPWYSFFVWLIIVLLTIIGIIGVIAVVATANQSDDEDLSDDNDAIVLGMGLGAFMCAASAFVTWNWFYNPTPHISRTATAQEITEKYREKCYQVGIAYEEEGFWSDTLKGGTGSGLLIANDRNVGLIVTNRHVVIPDSDFKNYRIAVKRPNDTDSSTVRVAAVHSEVDLAFLLVEGDFGRRESIKIASEASIKQGEDAIAIGNPRGVEFVTSEGIISSKQHDGHLVTTCPISPGNSGGPLFLARRGLLAGINTSTTVDAQNLNFAIPAEYIVVLTSGELASGWVWHDDEDRKEVLRQLKWVKVSK